MEKLGEFLLMRAHPQGKTPRMSAKVRLAVGEILGGLPRRMPRQQDVEAARNRLVAAGVKDEALVWLRHAMIEAALIRRRQDRRARRSPNAPAISEDADL